MDTMQQRQQTAKVASDNVGNWNLGKFARPVERGDPELVLKHRCNRAVSLVP